MSLIRPALSAEQLLILNSRIHEETGCTGRSLRCPAPAPTLKVEKIEGGFIVAGVVVATSCQLALPVFGCLFFVVGIVLTVASYRGREAGEADDQYEDRVAFTRHYQVLGPICISISILMLLAGLILFFVTRHARRREPRVGFHCPVHGDFYPLSPVALTSVSRVKSNLCCTYNSDKEQLVENPPLCPHSTVSSTRSSVSSGPISPCPTPLPFLVNSSSLSVGGTLSSELGFGSTNSLSVHHDVASFPLSPSPPSSTRLASSSPTPMDPEVSVHSRSEHSMHHAPVVEMVVPQIKLVAPVAHITYTEDSTTTSVVTTHNKPKKSVSIVLPTEGSASGD